MFYYDVAPFNVAEVPEPFNQGFEIGPLFLGTASVPKHPDYRNSSRLLRPRRERPRSRAADERQEIAALHSLSLVNADQSFCGDVSDGRTRRAQLQDASNRQANDDESTVLHKDRGQSTEARFAAKGA